MFRLKKEFQLKKTKYSKKENKNMLIGLDVICLGDFAISTYDGTVCFSFSYPSQGFIDFNKQ